MLLAEQRVIVKRDSYMHRMMGARDDNETDDASQCFGLYSWASRSQLVPNPTVLTSTVVAGAPAPEVQ